jgi:hypothetical protein
MEKFFTPNKFFLFFCVLFVLEFLGLQWVSYMHITDQAKLDGGHVFNWTWPSKNVRSIGQIYKTKILKRTNNDATIEIWAEKHMDQINNSPTAQPIQKKDTPIDKCAVQLTYYRMNNKWFLGRVEFE